MTRNRDMFNIADAGGNFGSLSLSHKFIGKPMSGSNIELPQFSLTGGWDGNKWKNSKVEFNIRNRKKTPIKQIITSPSGKKHTFTEIKNDTGIQTTTGWIDKVTLSKGANTILGMSKQVDQFGNVVRGNNYANPDFYAYENKKSAEAAKQQTIDNLPDALKGGAVEKAMTSHKPASGPNQFEAKGGYAGIKKRNAQRRAARERSMKASLTTNPNVVFANSILSSIGKPQITTYNQRIGYGNRYTTKYTADPVDVVNDYYLKTGVIEYAKEQDPEHAKLDPKRTVTVVDKASSKRVANVWCHNNRCRTTGYSTVNTSTYKDVLISTRPKYVKMDALYGKIIDKSKEKKAKYSKYYETDPDVKVYNYYGISDESFASYEGYKQDLISTISGRRSNQEQIIDQLDLETKTLEKKDRSDSLIPELAKTNEKLDVTADELKNKIDNFNWQGKISKESFGKDEITGDSHVGHVLQSYNGEVRGGDYYVQDSGKLIRKTKRYERQLKKQIKEKTKEIDEIEVDKTEGLVDFYNDKSNKEYGKASKEYLEKSLVLTEKEREELEEARRAAGFGSHQPARRGGGGEQRGRPSLKQKSRSRRQYRNRRTRGGKNTLGGLVV